MKKTYSIYKKVNGIPVLVTNLKFSSKEEAVAYLNGKQARRQQVLAMAYSF